MVQNQSRNTGIPDKKETKMKSAGIKVRRVLFVFAAAFFSFCQAAQAQDAKR
jgi:hypothetical protein